MDTQARIYAEAMTLRERAVSDIQKTAANMEKRNLDEIKCRHGRTPEAAEAYKNCRMAAAALLIDRWGIGMDREICSALKLDCAELHEYLSEDEVAEAAAEYEDWTPTKKELKEIAEELQQDKTGAADAGSNAEILRRLDELEDSIHAIGTQVEAIWLHTGAVMLDDEGQAEK